MGAHAIGAELQTVELELSQFIGVLVQAKVVVHRAKFNVSLFVVFLAMHAYTYVCVYITVIDPLQLRNNLFGHRPCWSTSPVSTAKNCTKVHHTYAILLSDAFASLRRIA